MIALSWHEILEVGLLVGTVEGQRVRQSLEDGMDLFSDKISF